MAGIDIVVEMHAPDPVYEQIVRQIHDGVKAGRLRPGTPLPTVRQLAGDLMLNRNTVARAYKMLEDQGVILTAGRKGTFVRQDATREVAKLTTNHAQRAMRRVIERLLLDGLNRDEIANVFKTALRLAGKGSGT
jgi:DNA-binding transcriptional regulator YhcF (GntR family)